MHTPNPPLGLAYIAGALKQAGFRYSVIDDTGEALDRVSPYAPRPDALAWRPEVHVGSRTPNPKGWLSDHDWTGSPCL